MGYVEAQEEQSKSLIEYLLPKTLAGLALWLLIFAMGVASSGIILFAYYQYNLAALRQEMNDFSEKFEKDFDKKSEEFNTLVKDSKAEIEKAAQGAGSQTNEVKRLLEKIAPSVAYVAGTDGANAPASGSGFVVTSNNNESWVITNFRIVAGAAAGKQPVRVRIGTADREGTVWSWDERRDLALVILKTGNLPVLEWDRSEPEVGGLVWSVGAGSGKLGAVAAQGHLMDNAGDGYLVSGGIPPSSAGGPLLNREGKVLSVLSTSYAPEGFAAGSWSIPIRLACQKVLRCPS